MLQARNCLVAELMLRERWLSSKLAETKVYVFSILLLLKTITGFDTTTSMKMETVKNCLKDNAIPQSKAKATVLV